MTVPLLTLWNKMLIVQIYRWTYCANKPIRGVEVRSDVFLAVGKHNSLQKIARIGQLHRSSVSHLGPRGHRQYGMRFHPQTELFWRGASRDHVVKLLAELFCGIGYVAEPLYHFLRCVEAADIEVAVTVAEPSPICISVSYMRAVRRK